METSTKSLQVIIYDHNNTNPITVFLPKGKKTTLDEVARRHFFLWKQRYPTRTLSFDRLNRLARRANGYLVLDSKKTLDEIDIRGLEALRVYFNPFDPTFQNPL
jgi:hypothetical protein